MGCSNPREDLEDQIMLIRLKRMNIQMEKEKQCKKLSEIEGKNINLDNLSCYLEAVHKGMNIKEIKLEEVCDNKANSDNNNINKNPREVSNPLLSPKIEQDSEMRQTKQSPPYANDEQNEINTKFEETNNITPIKMNIGVNNNIVNNNEDGQEFNLDLTNRKQKKKKKKKKKINKISPSNNINYINNVDNINVNNNNVQNDVKNNNNENNENINNNGQGSIPPLELNLQD